MNEQTNRMLEVCLELARDGNRFAQLLAFQIAHAEDPDAAAESILRALEETGRRLALYAREHEEEIREAIRQMRAEDNN